MVRVRVGVRLRLRIGSGSLEVRHIAAVGVGLGGAEGVDRADQVLLRDVKGRVRGRVRGRVLLVVSKVGLGVGSGRVRGRVRGRALLRDEAVAVGVERSEGGEQRLLRRAEVGDGLVDHQRDETRAVDGDRGGAAAGEALE